MITVWASLSSAQKQVQTLAIPELTDAILHLTVASALAEAYDKIWHSIYWKHATTATKNRVRRQLDVLAFDVYTHLNDAGKCVNAYVDSGRQLPDNWSELILSLNRSRRAIEYEQRGAIDSKQLSLPV